MTRIAGELDAARAAGETPAPMAVNLLTHDSNPRFEPDFAIVRKWEPPVVITSVGRPEVVIDAVHGYGGLVFADVVSLHHARRAARRSEEHTSELQSLMRISYAVFCLKKKKNK